MKKAVFLILTILLCICSAITASQGDIEILSEDCDCCAGSKNSNCYSYYGVEILSCGKGTNICDMAPPPEGM